MARFTLVVIAVLVVLSTEGRGHPCREGRIYDEEPETHFLPNSRSAL